MYPSKRFRLGSEPMSIGNKVMGNGGREGDVRRKRQVKRRRRERVW